MGHFYYKNKSFKAHVIFAYGKNAINDSIYGINTLII